jgi:hypothetical protein
VVKLATSSPGRRQVSQGSLRISSWFKLHFHACPFACFRVDSGRFIHGASSIGVRSSFLKVQDHPVIAWKGWVFHSCVVEGSVVCMAVGYYGSQGLIGWKDAWQSAFGPLHPHLKLIVRVETNCQPGRSDLLCPYCVSRQPFDKYCEWLQVGSANCWLIRNETKRMGYLTGQALAEGSAFT